MAAAVWLGIPAALGLLDYWCDLGEPDGDTLSEFTRRAFFVHTPAGKAAFTFALAGGATWLHRHITKEI